MPCVMHFLLLHEVQSDLKAGPLHVDLLPRCNVIRHHVDAMLLRIFRERLRQLCRVQALAIDRHVTACKLRCQPKLRHGASIDHITDTVQRIGPGLFLRDLFRFRILAFQITRCNRDASGLCVIAPDRRKGCYCLHREKCHCRDSHQPFFNSSCFHHLLHPIPYSCAHPSSTASATRSKTAPRRPSPQTGCTSEFFSLREMFHVPESPRNRNLVPELLPDVKHPVS